MEIRYIKGNLFTTTESMAHCISADAKMGAGIAKKFRARYPTMPSVIANKHINEPASIAYKVENRYVFNLITKAKYWQKPTYSSLTIALIEMRKQMDTLKIDHVSMPKIGAGLDRLSWSKVENILYKVFKNTNYQITVYYL